MSRLIDADALIDGYKHMGYDPSEHPEESYMEGWCKGFNSAVDHCTHHVIHAPTIEPERKTGKWVRYDGDWLKTMCKCSECGAMIDINEKYRNFFCYHCGAYMRGEQE